MAPDMGICNLNDGIQELEGSLKLLRKSGEETDDNKQEMQSLVIQINKLKRESNKPFF